MSTSIVTRKMKTVLSVLALSCSVFALQAQAHKSGYVGRASLGLNQDYISALNFDFSGENGTSLEALSPGIITVPTNSVGFPCGVPNNYSWKFSVGGTTSSELKTLLSQYAGNQAGAAWLQVYNDCSPNQGRQSVPNARIELSRMYAYYFSISQQQWIQIVDQGISGGAYAEDFLNNQNVIPDLRSESQDGSGYVSVRSGIGNASGVAGTSTGRTAEDGSIGYNFHGYANRFSINWADVQAAVVVQAMRCIPNAGTDLTDCKKLGYIAGVGLDSWATTSSGANKEGVGFGKFKPVTTDWQLFTNFLGDQSIINNNPPPLPQG